MKDVKKTNIEWVQEQMRAKVANLSSESRGQVDAADWMDRCGAIAAIRHDAAKALASIYVWPDRNRDQDEQIIITELAQQMMWACARENQNQPRTGDAMTLTLNQLASKTAKMGLFFYIHNIRDHYTTKGRLHMAGIPISDHSWAKTWRQFEDLMVDQLGQWYTIADMYIGEYRQSMRDG